MSIRHLFATAILTASTLAVPAVAQASAQPMAASVTTMSSGRVGAIVAALIGLTGVLIGGLALTGRLRLGSAPLIALLAGLIAMVIGGLVVATSDGGLGTGNGLGGAFVGLLVGLASSVLGGLGLIRSRRTA
ncbi:DUF6223 family protein [Nocardia suismassiliense]|uniref:DUF6223 family protein n=1 Tax=Nocardia suismassiliense TaxID=2077092 RepID=UPI000D1D8F75|nr:DUF6223 family protein [Nocardia suismassiliense]